MRTLKIYKRIKKKSYRSIKKNKTLKIYNRNKKYKRYNNKKYKRYNLRGGEFVSQNIINIIENSESSINIEMDPIFKIIPEYANELIYISIGSKFNELFFDNYDKNNKMYRTFTNTGYQMVPFFLCKNSKPRENVLCNSEPCKVLNIVVDIFNNEEEIEYSKTNINKSLFDKRTMDYGLDTTNITQFFINILEIRNEMNPHNIDSQISFLGNLIDIISKKIRENNVDNNNFMVCNYIKFKQPNTIESKFENNISMKILEVLTVNNYSDSCYDWCGYNPIFFYNCIRLTSKIKFFQQYNLLQLKELDPYDENNIFEIKEEELNIANIKSKKIVENLQYIFPIKNIYDEKINEGKYPINRFNNFVYSIYEFIKLNE